MADDEEHRHDIEQHEGGARRSFDASVVQSCNPQRIGGKTERCCSTRVVIGRVPSTTLAGSKRQASSSMQARHARGTRVGRGHRVHGEASWARQLVPTFSCSPTPMSDWKRRTGCGRRWGGSPTPNVRGRCSSNVQGHGVAT